MGAMYSEDISYDLKNKKLNQLRLLKQNAYISHQNLPTKTFDPLSKNDHLAFFIFSALDRRESFTDSRCDNSRGAANVIEKTLTLAIRMLLTNEE
jgi:hypothetical protein